MEVSVRTNGDIVILRVKDYGPGIPTNTLAALKSNKQHAGVGLTAMKERVKEQGSAGKYGPKIVGTEIIGTIPLLPTRSPRPPSLRLKMRYAS